MKFNPHDLPMDIAWSMFVNFKAGRYLETFNKVPDDSQYFGQGLYVIRMGDYYYFQKSNQLICDEVGDYYKLPSNQWFDAGFIAKAFLNYIDMYFGDTSIYKLSYLIQKANDTLGDKFLVRFEMDNNFACSILFFENGECISVVTWEFQDFIAEISHFEEICGGYNNLIDYMEAKA